MAAPAVASLIADSIGHPAEGMPTLHRGYSRGKSKGSGLVYVSWRRISDAWSSSGAQSRLQAESFDGRFHPFEIAERTPSFGTIADRHQFLLRQRCIDAFDPSARSRNRPRGQHGGFRRGILEPVPKRPPPPLFGSGNQFGSQRVAFHIPADRQEMRII